MMATNSIDSTNFSLRPYVEAKPYYEASDWINDIAIHAEQYYASIPYYQGSLPKESLPDWIFLLLILGTSMIAYVISVHRKRSNMLAKTFINWKLSKQIIRYEKVYSHPVNIALNINFIISVSLFAVLALKLLNPDKFNIQNHFPQVLGLLLLYGLFKITSHKFMAWIFQLQELIEEYIFQLNLINKYTGVFFLILTALLIYSPLNESIILTIGASIFVILSVLQLSRGVMIGIQKVKNLFFIILYLCTLEILPWLVVGKWIHNQL